MSTELANQPGGAMKRGGSVAAVTAGRVALVVALVVAAWLGWATVPRGDDSWVHYPDTCWQGAVSFSFLGVLVLLAGFVAAVVAAFKTRGAVLVLWLVVALVLFGDVVLATYYMAQLNWETACD